MKKSPKRHRGILIVDTRILNIKDVIYDVIDKYVNDGEEMLLLFEMEELSEEICKALNICEKCGAKLRGERNE